mmetsp:Transcript_12093/g.22627  ORF Transcript_12093/g.22627 Transcript_12093/m.22627 type:complete len:500 (+) Transcript_12093:125-1624(+)|eukprot:CAMPEP_0176485460 /NCGR_PEP_ID=MMETSP0200_2-20121128/5048_1 /TAXON_ID=947934 /ORGANISM="Chaetoceros sp., Strain GSL56" /LENGTH=499 /DNA_ID=CAMNT_0017882099 /DNA_START=97 /DNA_END=1596 /DNA_ORIENTATION=-
MRNRIVLVVFVLAVTAATTSTATNVLPCGATFFIPAPRANNLSKKIQLPHHRKVHLGKCCTNKYYPILLGRSRISHLSTAEKLSSTNDDEKTAVDDRKLGVFNTSSNSSNKNQRLIGILVLLSVPLSWGTYAPVVKYVYEMNPPTPGFVFSAAYYLIASLTLVSISSYSSVTKTVDGVVAKEEAVDRDFLLDETTPGNNMPTLPVPNSSTLQLSEKTLGGFELGTYLFMGNCLQVVGLESIPADRAAFLVQLTTIMVPLLQATFARDISLIPTTTWVACILAFAGVIIMGFDRPDLEDIVREDFFQSIGGMMSHDGVSFSGGDTLIILAALCYSMHVIRLGKYAKLTNPLELAASKATVEAVLSVALVLGFIAIPSWTGDTDIPTFVQNESRNIQTYFSQLQFAINEGTFPSDGFLMAIVASFWTGLVTCAYTIYAQSFGQRRVEPTDANLIYTMQPVFSAIFAWALLGEKLGTFGYAGAAFIGVALWIVTSSGDKVRA